MKKRVILAVLVLLFGTMPGRGQESTSPKPLTTAQQARIQEQNRLGAEAQKLRAAGKLDEAVAAIEQLLVIEREVYGEQRLDAQANWLASLGYIHEQREDFAAARQARKEMLALRTKLNGADHWQTTDARLASKHVELLAKLSPRQRADLAEATRLNGTAFRLDGEGKYRAALQAAQQSLELRKAVLGEKHPDFATSLNNLAALYASQGEYAKAEPLYRQALELRKAVLGEKHPHYANSLHNLASLYDSQGEYAKAEPLYHQALALRKAVLGEKHPAYATSLNNLAALYASQGEYAKAEPLFRQALLAEAPGYSDPLESITPDAFRLAPGTTLQLRNYVALLRYRLGNAPSLPQLRACEQAYALTLAVQERLRQEVLTHDDSKIQHGADDFEVVPGRLHVLRMLYVAERDAEVLHTAVTTAEQGRARVFLDQLGRGRAGAVTGLPSALRQREADLLARQRQLDLAYAKEADRGLKADADRLRKLFEERRQTEDDLQKLVAEMVEASPQYAALRYPKPCTLAEARACLGANEVALLFALGGAESAVVLVEGRPAKDDPTDGIAIFELPKAEEINDLVASITDDPVLEKPARVRTLGKTAYQKLLGPLADRIKGKDLVIVPGESLGYLPFELLIEDGKFLIEKHGIRYAPSLTALHMVRRWEQDRKQRPPRMAWAVGDPLYPSAGVAVASRDSSREYLSREGRRDDETFLPLPASGAEVRAITQLLGNSRVFTGADVLEATVKQASADGELAKYRYIHFATHGILGFDKGQQPALVLSLVGNDGARDELGVNDGFLRLSEVTGLKLNADLVVLSACRSGQGRMANGEGVSGLARAFLYAGSRGVVCSLWSVADQETAELMTGMYGRLKTGVRSADALREAKLAMIRDGKAPIFWAPFVLIGE